MNIGEFIYRTNGIFIGVELKFGDDIIKYAHDPVAYIDQYLDDLNLNEYAYGYYMNLGYHAKWFLIGIQLGCCYNYDYYSFNPEKISLEPNFNAVHVDGGIIMGFDCKPITFIISSTYYVPINFSIGVSIPIKKNIHLNKTIYKTI